MSSDAMRAADAGPVDRTPTAATAMLCLSLPLRVPAVLARRPHTTIGRQTASLGSRNLEHRRAGCQLPDRLQRPAAPGSAARAGRLQRGALSCVARCPIVVQKYGGSSVADVTRLKQVAERIMRTKAGLRRRRGRLGDGRHDGRPAGAGAAGSPNPDRRELDMLLSAGERISMALLSLAIRERGGDAISFTGSQSGIITNDRHVDARIIEVRPFRVQDELARGRVVVIAGYQGVSYRREVTTLGRGGSDTTAVAMAAASAPNTARSAPTWTASTPPIRESSPRRARRHALLRGNPGAGRGGREGAQRTGGRVREGERNRDLRARNSVALPGADPSSDGTVVRRDAPRMPGTVVGVASERRHPWSSRPRAEPPHCLMCWTTAGSAATAAGFRAGRRH